MIIEIKNLEIAFKNTVAVNDVSLEIERGKIFGLLGPNGAGKTTLIRSILGLIDYDKGEVLIYNEKFSNKSLKTKKKMGYVPQELAFYEELSAIDNVRYWGKIYGLHKEDLTNAVKEALQFTGLWERRKEKSKNFSGGMKRRLNIACAIVHKPQILIMDEPTVGVDPQSRNKILECIQILNQNDTTVIYTSHYMEEIEAICNQVAIMDFGKVICTESIEEIISSNCKERIITIPFNHSDREKYTELRKDSMIKDITFSDEIVSIVYSNKHDLSSILNSLIKAEIDIDDMIIKKENLESVFLSLTGKRLRD